MAITITPKTGYYELFGRRGSKACYSKGQLKSAADLDNFVDLANELMAPSGSAAANYIEAKKSQIGVVTEAAAAALTKDTSVGFNDLKRYSGSCKLLDGSYTDGTIVFSRIQNTHDGLTATAVENAVVASSIGAVTSASHGSFRLK